MGMFMKILNKVKLTVVNFNQLSLGFTASFTN